MRKDIEHRRHGVVLLSKVFEAFICTCGEWYQVSKALNVARWLVMVHILPLLLLMLLLDHLPLLSLTRLLHVTRSFCIASGAGHDDLMLLNSNACIELLQFQMLIIKFSGQKGLSIARDV